jgi:putative effector of murein hydrolase LrgA (UPF0299 family)
MELLVTAVSGALIALCFYLSSKIVNRYIKVLKNNQWKNFVIAVIGFIIMMIFLGLIMSIMI